MNRRLSKLLFVVTVVIIIGHNILPHLHHEEEHLVGQHHHEDADKDHHNIFSFAEFDETFLPSKLKTTAFFPIISNDVSVINFQLIQIPAGIKPWCNYEEFPPPGKYQSTLFSRPPPAC